MKKFKVLPAFFVLLTALAFTSCDTEPVDNELVGNNPTPENPNNPGNPNNPNNPGNPTNPGTSTGNYWPMAIGNEWIFDLEGEVQPLEMTSTEVIEGNTYYRMDQFFAGGASTPGGVTSTATTRLRHNNGDYYARISAEVPAQPGMPAVVVTPYEYIFLKDYLAVGQSWTSTATQVTSYPGIPMPPITMTLNITGTVMEKGVSATVDGVVYNNVMKVKLVQNINMMGQTSSTVSHMWLAKDIGPIFSESEGLGVNYSYILTDYTLN